MDYDDNDFQSQNLHLAGEGSNKFPPVLRPYALPKFDFDDSLHGSLRFDNLVETEVFLGIENNEDSQWIEDYSRGSSGIQFRSSAAESCTISRCNNVWSEATSSESVEMLLKSVGQEELIPAQTNSKEPDACDELGCIIKQMEPSLKQDSNISTRVGDVTNLQSTSLPSELKDNLSVVDDGGSEQQTQVEDSSLTHKGDVSVDQSVGDFTAMNVEVKVPVAEGKMFVDGKGNDANQRDVDAIGNECLDIRTKEGSASGAQVDCAVTTVQGICTGNDVLNNEDASNSVNKTAGENLDVSGTENAEHQEKGCSLNQGAQTHAQVLNTEIVESGGSQMDNTLCMASVESMEEPDTAVTNFSSVDEPCIIPKQDLSIEVHDQSKVDAHEVPLAVVEGNTTVQKHEAEYSNVDNKDIVSASGMSLLSTQDNKASQDIGAGSCSSYGTVSSGLPDVGSSVEFISKIQVKGHISSSALVGSIQTCEKKVASGKGDVDNDVTVQNKESMELPSDSIITDKIIDKGDGTSSFGEGSTKKDLIDMKSQSDCTAVSELVDGVPVPSGSDINTDAVDHKDAEVPPLPAVSRLPAACMDKEEEISAQVSEEASLADCKAASQVTTGVHSLSAVDTCHAESQIGPQAVATEKVGQECMQDKEACPAHCASTANKGGIIEATIKQNDEKKPVQISELTVNVEMCGPEPSVMKENCQGTSQIGQQDPVASVSGGERFDKIAFTSTNVGQESNTDLDKLGCGTSTVIRATGLSHSESNMEQIKKSSDYCVTVSEVTVGDAIKVQSASKDPSQNDASKDDSSFTFEISPQADLPIKDAKKWQIFSNVEVSKASMMVDGSNPNSGLGQLDSKISQDISRGSPKISDAAAARSGSKSNSERKPRRSSGKAAAKETVKKGKPIKETASMRLERADKTTTVSMSPSGVPQLVQSNDMQRYGHIDSNSIKSFVLATSSSSLPDLNSSVSQAAIFQQPFTDLQQVQLRAQIFVYGALIQGTPPDEAYMISAFGGLDGGRSIWENAWRSCVERLNGQKSHIIAPETPMQSRSGVRALEQSIKQSALPSKVVSSPIARVGSKGTPPPSPPIVNPIVPLSSPLWSMPTPADTLQSSGMPRGPVMDYQRALSPLNPHQTPAIRNFVGHNSSWLSQAPFGGPWVASPPTSALDTSGRFSVPLPVTDPIHLTPGKESSVSHSSGAKPPVAQSTPASAFPGPSVLDLKTTAASASQPSADTKYRRRKKTSTNENLGQISLPPQPQIESISASAVVGSVSASVAIATPVGFVSKAPAEKLITSVTPIASTDLRKGGQNAELGAVFSEESLGNIKEASEQAEIAAAHAASAVSRSQEIWDQLDKQRNSGLLPDVEIKLASAAVSVAAAAAVAKAAAAAAKVASNAALQAKLMAEEALVSVGQSNLLQTNIISYSNGMKNLGKATPASILKGDDGTNSSSSILVAAREAARRRVEAASAASKRAENLDAIVKAAELAAEAVSQAGKIVAMGDPLPLNELVAAGPEGYWKVAQGSSELVSKSNNVGRDKVNLDSGEGSDTLARQLKGVPSDKKENQIYSQGKSPNPRVISSEDHDRVVDGVSGSSATNSKGNGQKGRKASDLARTTEVAPESGNESRYNIVQNEYEKAEAFKENSIKEDSSVEVFKDGNGFKGSWFLAKVLSLKDGKACVSYTELTTAEGSEKLKDWVPLQGEGDEAPKIRIARPVTVMPFEGTRKRRRAAMGEHIWSVGDKVDAWIQDSWWEGVITEKSKKDESFSVHFPAQGETSLVSKWNLRPSLIWKEGEWIEWPNSGENNHPSHGGDTPHEKRPRVRSPVVEFKGKDKASKTMEATESGKADDPTLLALSADEKLFNIGKSARDGNRTDALRMTRTGLQKEGSRVIFGVPKPGKKRKFMEVSKHYVADQSGQPNEANDSVKFTKYLMPQGAGSRGWKSTSKTELNEKRTAISKPKVLKSGKSQNISGRTIPQKENLTSTSVSIPDDSALTDHVAKIKDSVDHSENASEKQNLIGFQSFSTSGATEGPILFSALALPSDNVSSKKIPSSNAKPERVSKGKLAPAGGKFGKIEEDKVLNGNSAKSTSDPVEPRRSNRRIQPTSRLLEGLQSSLMVSKIPSVSHDKSHRSRNISRGNNHG